MDCKTARLLLEFHRPRAGELDMAEAAALEEHLAGCHECEAAAAAERRVDEALGRAMRQVEVPDRLRARLLTGLAAERSERRHRQRGRMLRVAMAAAILLCCLAGYAWWHNRAPVIDQAMLESISEDVKADHFSPPDVEKVRERFKRMGIDVSVPRQLRYNYLTSCAIDVFEGREVPQMIFVREPSADVSYAYAKVWILSPRQFNLEQLHGNWQSEAGYPYRVDAIRFAGSPQVYVIVHTGDNLDWLKVRDEDRVS